ncbi:hypothetical protein BKA70DRAFT_1253570 [Coprinopsis sp. MPI-PUGE-AT-0042]|nr:hypothetical protein BKA70DRAFT_1253570 [Coprinopsis sp. MPI-PUGE-AT-0042]
MEPVSSAYLAAALRAVTTTNAIPPTQELSALSDHLTTLPPQLNQVNAEIKAQKLRLKTLKAQRDEILLQQSSIRAALNSPIRKLPAEILAEVLKACLPGELDRHKRLDFQRLRSVCRAWRRTAFSTPELWTGLKVSPDPSVLSSGSARNPEPEVVAGSILGWFDRAGGLPLTLTMLYDPGVKDRSYHFERRLVEAVYRYALSQSRNWHTIQFLGVTGGTPHAFSWITSTSNTPSGSPASVLPDPRSISNNSQLDVTPWSRLKHLAFPLAWPMNGLTGAEWPSPGSQLDRYAPALHTLSLTVSVHGDRRMNGVPCFRLRHQSLHTLILRIPYMAPELVTTMLQVIQNLPLLTILEIRHPSHSSDPEGFSLSGPQLPSIHHPHIHRLTLIGFGKATLRPLVLPNLRYLAVQDITAENDVASSLAMFLSRSQCQLTELHIRLSKPKFKESSWRKLWAPLCETGLLKEKSVHETFGGVIEGTWSFKIEGREPPL